MIVEQTPIKDLLVIKPSVFPDDRGYFFESYNKNRFHSQDITYDFVQDNESFSSYGTVRGIHLQTGTHAQAKLARVIRGRVLDVAVDLRADSPTFGKSFSIELSGENKTQLMIPRGFGHGFSVLSKEATFAYKCDNFYNKESESGIIFNDKTINIDWQIPEDEIKVSTKDMELLSFGQFCKQESL